jgi:DNA-binding IclR family transcriptional regulator
MNQLPAQPNKSLLEGIEVLFAVASRADAVGVRELARELGLTPTRLQRYLGTLAHLGLTRQGADRKYGVGPGIHALSALGLSASGLAGRAMAVLPSFSDLNCVVALGVLWRDTVSYLYFHNPGFSAAESLGRAGGYRAEDSSIGRMLMARLPAEELKRRYPGMSAALRRELKAVGLADHALVERPDGELSLAVPVGVPAVAGLAVSGRIRRATVAGLVKRLRAAAVQIAGEETAHS